MSEEEIKKLREENAYIRQQNRELEIKLHQAMGTLGYPVPGDIPEGNFKCGMCEAKSKSLFERQIEFNLLMSVHKMTIRELAQN